MYHNLTPHNVDILDPDGEPSLTIGRNPDIPPPRVAESAEEVLPEDGIRIWEVSTEKKTSNLPEEKEGDIYVVSRLVAEANPQRRDLVFPYPVVRDEEGTIIGARGFGRVAPGLEGNHS